MSILYDKVLNKQDGILVQKCNTGANYLFRKNNNEMVACDKVRSYIKLWSATRKCV